MKLTLLGTSHGVPADNRYTSCYMLEVGENIYIFDAGAPVMDLLLRRGKDLTKVKALFNTHFHGDHIFGAIPMISLFNWYFKETDIDIYLPDEKSKNAVIGFIGATDSTPIGERVRLHSYESGVMFDDGVIKVTAVPTEHFHDMEKKSNAFLIEADGKSVLYTGDMSQHLAHDDFPKIAYDRYIDIILSECAHFAPEKLAESMEKVDTDLFIVSHIWPLDKIEKFESMADKFDFELLIAEDDDEIEF